MRWSWVRSPPGSPDNSRALRTSVEAAASQSVTCEGQSGLTRPSPTPIWKRRRIVLSHTAAASACRIDARNPGQARLPPVPKVAPIRSAPASRAPADGRRGRPRERACEPCRHATTATRSRRLGRARRRAAPGRLAHANPTGRGDWFGTVERERGRAPAAAGDEESATVARGHRRRNRRLAVGKPIQALDSRQAKAEHSSSAFPVRHRASRVRASSSSSFHGGASWIALLRGSSRSHSPACRSSVRPERQVRPTNRVPRLVKFTGVVTGGPGHAWA